MNEKKVLKIDDEAMKNVTGGQGDNEFSYQDAMTSIDVNKTYADSSNTVQLLCPACGGDLSVILKENNWNGVCPHCKKAFSVTE